MQTGKLVEFKEKDVIGQNADIGVEPNSLLADIEFMLWQTGYDATKTLYAIQRDLMVLTGRLQVKQNVEQKEAQ